MYPQYIFESAPQFGLADMIQFAGRTNKSSHFRRSIGDSSCFHHMSNVPNGQDLEILVNVFCPMIFSIFRKPVCERALFPKTDIMSEVISGHAIATDSSLLLCQLTRLLLLILPAITVFVLPLLPFLPWLLHLPLASAISSIGFCLFVFCFCLRSVEFIIQPWVQNMKANLLKYDSSILPK